MVASRIVAQFERKYTAVAGKAMDFATLFNTVFAAEIDGPVPYRVDLTTPVGPSTAGGKLALQHLRLVPPDAGAAIVLGTVSQTENTAELRTYRHLAEVHARRFNGARIPLDPGEYIKLKNKLQHFFAAQGFSMVLVDVTPSMAPPPPEASPAAARIGTYVAIGLVVIGGLVIGLLIVLMSGSR
ncbi:MAG: hypothetical protein U0359_20530 [Byssovorax sp.]